MSTQQSDDRVLHRIQKLVDEEHSLYGGSSLDDHGRERLTSIQVELDQCWDLLRQRRARREYGQDPAQASVRDPGTVERYTG